MSQEKGQWYNTRDRPGVMNHLAGFLSSAGDDLFASEIVRNVKDTYYTAPYKTKAWYNLDGELACLASEVLSEEK